MSRTDLNQTSQPIAPQRVHTYRTNIRQQYVQPLDVWSSSNVVVSNISSVVRKSAVNPNYQKLRGTGNLPPNAFQYAERTWRPQTGYTKFTLHNAGYDDVTETFGCISGTQTCLYSRASPSTAVILNTQNQSLTKALLKLKDQDVNLGEVWGERHESLQMIRQSVDRLGKAYSSLRSGNYRGAAAALGVNVRNSAFSSQWSRNQSKAIANGWLELQYGWLPAVHDIYGAIEAFHKTLSSPKTELVRVVAMSQLNDGSSVTAPWTYGTIITNRSYDLQVKTCLYYRRRSTVLHTLAALGITNPAVVAWELTKYSFILDWLLPIGNFLSALDASVGYDWAFGCQTNVVRAKEEVVRQYSKGSFAQQDAIGQSVEFDERFSCDRAVLNPLSAVPLPTLKDPRSLMHVLNSLALFRQSFKR